MIRGTAALQRRLVRPVLTIGNFDGVHRGHHAILDIVMTRARTLDGEAVLYTFDPHPRKVLQPERAPLLLATLDQKLEVLEEIGLDVVIVEPFDRSFAKTPPDRFVREYVHGRIAPAEVYVGYDFHFGRDREGSMRLLTETGPRLGFSVTIVPEVTIAGRDVNSTRIRELVSLGEMDEVTLLLGRPFGVRGRVITGDGRGRELGFPTANIEARGELLPSVGVYICDLRQIGGMRSAGEPRIQAVTNVGRRPTFGSAGTLQVEAHLLGFSGDLYGSEVDLRFLSRLRGERRFRSVDALRERIARDVEEARAWWTEKA